MRRINRVCTREVIRGVINTARFDSVRAATGFRDRSDRCRETRTEERKNRKCHTRVMLLARLKRGNNEEAAVTARVYRCVRSNYRAGRTYAPYCASRTYAPPYICYYDPLPWSCYYISVTHLIKHAYQRRNEKRRYRPLCAVAFNARMFHSKIATFYMHSDCIITLIVREKLFFNEFRIS